MLNQPQDQQDLKFNESLLKIFDKKQSQINQDVYITDMLVTASNSKFSYGEAKDCNNSYQNNDQISVLERLIDMIQTLATIANMQHKKNYCEAENGSHRLMDNCLNKITRLLLSEFSLYTSNPLKMKDFRSCLQFT
jgi:hypothetical protein